MTSVPSANEFRHLIKRAAGEPNLGDGTDAVPLKQAGKTIDIAVSMGVTTPGPLKADSFVVTNLEDGKPYAGGVCLKGKRFQSHLYLEDGNGKVLAKVFKEGGKLGAHEHYQICATKPFHTGQKPLPSRTVREGHCFCWAKVGGDNFHSKVLKVEMFSHKDGGGEYVETYVSEPHLPKGGIMALKTQFPPMSFKRTDGSFVAFVTERKRENPLAGPSFTVHIAPGMDPCLVICFVGILSEYEKASPHPI